LLNRFLFNEVIPDTAVPPSYYHYCIDGSYRTLSQNVNHTYVIARDQNGDLFFSSNKDDAELARVGERLDFRLLTALDTRVEAEAAAAALRTKACMNTAGGYIVIQPDCGAQLWDVICIYDSVSNQEGSVFRICAVGLVWDSAAGRYVQRLTLCAV
jgi:hypothetical protein